MKKLWKAITRFGFGNKPVAIDEEINTLAEKDRLKVDDGDISQIRMQINDVSDDIEKQLKALEAEKQQLKVKQIGVQIQQNRLDALDNDRNREQLWAAEDHKATGD